MTTCVCGYNQRSAYERGIDPNHEVDCPGWVEWDPGQFDNSPRFASQATTREGYEALCQALGITPNDDAHIRRAAYGLRYADFSREQWAAKTTAWHCLWRLDQKRLSGIEAEAKAYIDSLPARPAAIRELLVCRECGQAGHRGEHPFSTNPASGLCDDCH